jgi:hypothetical protein
MTKRLGGGIPFAPSVLAVLGAALAVVFVQANRSGRSIGDFVSSWFGGEKAEPVKAAPGSEAWGPDALSMFVPRTLGGARFAAEKPLIAHVRVVDLDRDGANDVLTCDVLAARVTWLRGGADGSFTEMAIGDSIPAPVHAEPSDLDQDGDTDVLVAAMGVMLPNNDPIGSVIVLENDGRNTFRTRTLAKDIARVTDVQAGDLDGDGDLDLAVGQFGYDQGEIRWMENLGGWRFESHSLLNLAGTIHAPIGDLDGDGDLDIVALVSQEWEEIHVFENDGRGTFQKRIVFGAATDDYCSSGIALGDLDGDRDLDLLYTNGDAFVATDYRPLPNHGVQWLENVGGLAFAFHRLASYSGAYGPVITDLDGDGDPDGVVVSCFNDWSKPSARALTWFENTGNARFVAHGLATKPTHLVTLAAGDLDNDGKVDLVSGGMALYPPFETIERVTAWFQKSP